ncbi:Na/Pi cotransporter family protein [Dolosicoccus paucivorans]|uniref:Na/Pi cotransporter family protein n=1 Tax=Dolosicoccus paucivorans TaxID=84521 RepID=A0A1G8MAD8_9LACT|nr:Na/Pi cotransporter family protein [Dolosicoccus paucivorans]PMB83750.1 Na/Pi cotransporter family protein [Dolosicoccus paucivorans]PMC57814.1 Na/Pi cotransporter family protein [Dolosicoccus paucivorans]SDI64891.1 phosphate:Na+ symporter [Dolosicoccus paucivorans]
MNFQAILFQFLGGLGVFLFGISLMGEGLKRTAGDSLRGLLQRFTQTPLRAVLTGIIVTVLIQSSSGTTVLVVGLVSAGFMTLEQAIGVVLGANVGTTVTSFIIGINLGAYALPIIGIGSICIFFFKRPTIQHIGEVILGFGMLFYGLELMGNGMAPLQDFEPFQTLMLSLADHALLSTGLGAILTMIMQSSSAVIGILQQLFAQNSISMAGALPFMIGSNVGTTITTIMATVGANVAAKRTALAHVVFNVFGSIVFLILLNPFTQIILRINEAYPLNPAMQIAVAHGIFNVISLLLMYWFIPQLAALMVRLIPTDPEEKEVTYDDSKLDTAILLRAGPTLALQQAQQELVQLSHLVYDVFEETEKYYLDKKERRAKKVHQLEEVINMSDGRLMSYVGLIAEHELGNHDSETLTAIINTSKYLERIADHAVTIADSVSEAIKIEDGRKEKGNHNTPGREMQWGDQKLNEIFALVRLNIEQIVDLIDGGDFAQAKDIIEREAEINQLESRLRTRFITLIRNGKSRPADNILFIDIVANLERIGDHTRKLVLNHLQHLGPFPAKEIDDAIGETQQLGV